VYLDQHRFTEALEAGQVALALEPLNADPVQFQAMVYLAMGDLNGARAVVRSGLSRGIPATTVAAIFAGYFEMAWSLDEAELNLLFRLTPPPSTTAGVVGPIAGRYWQQGNVRLRAYGDSALAPTAAQVAPPLPEMASRAGSMR
jgi:hypothetical protein